ncbi:MAG: hypothetical protein AUG51_16440 [Acidobacteria bacterium 13_1_20CM_3_53_8]|nr:MAG: hypothetical protein AUG51_16440 [Acidobacteria bacterium 13_1_20CM_3_53_8]
MLSPYADLSTDKWLSKTKELIELHPLKLNVIKDIALLSWGTLWLTKIGEGDTAIRLEEIEVPATVVGYFFEKLFAKELQSRFPTEWRGGQSKDEKDIVCINHPFYSIEMKTSGQLGVKIFGNRSYGQKAEDESLVSKVEKSGYYITANFYGKTLTLLRFGWIDASDWKPQKSATGQAASLSNDVYKYKLIEIPGDYRLSAPIGLLNGIGVKAVKEFAEESVVTIYDLLNYQGSNKRIHRFREIAKDQIYKFT